MVFGVASTFSLVEIFFDKKSTHHAPITVSTIMMRTPIPTVYEDPPAPVQQKKRVHRPPLKKSGAAGTENRINGWLDNTAGDILQFGTNMMGNIADLKRRITKVGPTIPLPRIVTGNYPITDVTSVLPALATNLKSTSALNKYKRTIETLTLEQLNAFSISYSDLNDKCRGNLACLDGEFKTTVLRVVGDYERDMEHMLVANTTLKKIEKDLESFNTKIDQLGKDNATIKEAVETGSATVEAVVKTVEAVVKTGSATVEAVVETLRVSLVADMTKFHHQLSRPLQRCLLLSVKNGNKIDGLTQNMMDAFAAATKRDGKMMAGMGRLEADVKVTNTEVVAMRGEQKEFRGDVALQFQKNKLNNNTNTTQLKAQNRNLHQRTRRTIHNGNEDLAALLTSEEEWRAIVERKRADVVKLEREVAELKANVVATKKDVAAHCLTIEGHVATIDDHVTVINDNVATIEIERAKVVLLTKANAVLEEKVHSSEKSIHEHVVTIEGHIVTIDAHAATIAADRLRRSGAINDFSVGLAALVRETFHLEN